MMYFVVFLYYENGHPVVHDWIDFGVDNEGALNYCKERDWKSDGFDLDIWESLER